MRYVLTALLLGALLCSAAAPRKTVSPAVVPAAGASYSMLIGSEVRSFSDPPLARLHGKQWLSGAAVGLADRDPRFKGADLLSAGSTTYVSLDAAQREGYRLCFNALQNLLQLSGRIETTSYDKTKGALTLRCSTPLHVTGVQTPDDQSLVVLTVDGGWLGDTAPKEYTGDTLVTRMSFKGQPELGRSFIFVRQPDRVGFSVTNQSVGAAVSRPNVGGKLPPPQDQSKVTIRFGNFVDLTDLRKSASGEMAVTLQLGSKSDAHAQLLSSPPRLVLDLPGTQLDGPTRSYKAQGRATSVRLEDTAQGARLVVGLPGRLDWRLLRSDAGARWQLQLLPYAAGPSGQRAGRVILVDPGHGGVDTGALGVTGGVEEKALNTAITDKLIADLQGLGYTVLSTRTEDKFVSLGSRADYANLLLPWVFVSVHCNSYVPQDEGLITFVHPAAGDQSHQLAKFVQQEAIASTGAVDKGVREADYFVLRETVIPSILVECGFMSHTEECGRLCDPAYQQKIADGIAKGIDEYVTSGP